VRIEGVSFELVAAIFKEGLHPERPGTDGPGVERHIVGPESLLGVELFGFCRNGRKERHREPVGELRVLPLHADAKAIAVDNLNACERNAHEVEPGIIRGAALAHGLPFLTERLAEFMKSDNARAHRAENGTCDLRARNAANAVHVVGGNKFARIRFRKIKGTSHAGGFLRRQGVVEVFPVRVLGKSRMRRIADPGADADLIVRFRNQGRIGVGRKFPPLAVKIKRSRNGFGRPGFKHVGALQIRILVGGLIDRIGISRLVRRIGFLRIERSRASRAEGRKERFLSIVGKRPGTRRGIREQKAENEG